MVATARGDRLIASLFLGAIFTILSTPVVCGLKADWWVPPRPRTSRSFDNLGTSAGLDRSVLRHPDLVVATIHMIGKRKAAKEGFAPNTALQRTRSAPLRSPLSFETLGDSVP